MQNGEAKLQIHDAESDREALGKQKLKHSSPTPTNTTTHVRMAAVVCVNWMVNTAWDRELSAFMFVAATVRIAFPASMARKMSSWEETSSFFRPSTKGPLLGSSRTYRDRGGRGGSGRLGYTRRTRRWKHHPELSCGIVRGMWSELAGDGKAGWAGRGWVGMQNGKDYMGEGGGTRVLLFTVTRTRRLPPLSGPRRSCTGGNRQ